MKPAMLLDAAGGSVAGASTSAALASSPALQASMMTDMRSPIDAANLELTRGLAFSGTLLLALTEKGLSREDAYALVQHHAACRAQG